MLFILFLGLVLILAGHVHAWMARAEHRIIRTARIAMKDSMKDNIVQLIRNNNVMVFTKSYCRHSKKLVHELVKMNVSYHSLDVDVRIAFFKIILGHFPT